MGGHSHWAGIKHKKAVVDAKRGKVFTRIAREISIAAKLGGGSPEHNPRLRQAISDANAANMPKENVKRAIQRGTGELPGVTFEEVTYEGFGPAGVAVVVDTTTDSRNRTVVEIRRMFEDCGGSLGSAGSVAYLFEPKGLVRVPRSAVGEDELLEKVMEAGAENIETGGDFHDVTCQVGDLEAVKEAIRKAGVPMESAELTKIATTTVPIEEEAAKKLFKLLGKLEDHDDVKNVYSNFDIPDDVLSKLEA